MSLLKFVKNEFSNLSKMETMFFPLVIVFIAVVSLLKNDSIIALIASVCGITYTIFAGKGKISCYIFGLIATVCYSYLTFIQGYWGNFTLHVGYYLPMGIVGIFLWKKNLKIEKQEIKKTQLPLKQRLLYFTFAGVLSVVVFFLLGEKEILLIRVLDSITTVFALLGMFLTVKRCVEQWWVWFIVNICSALMWVYAYVGGANCISIILKWLVYAVLAVYFLRKWEKDLG